jgi:hypothetical protein
MAYYTALINAWNGATQPPSGVTGTGLTGSMTTAQKIAAVNGWTITGTVPTVLNVTGAQILNCINWTEFNALTATQQSNLLMLCLNDNQLLGGSSNTGQMVDGMLLAYFTNHSGPTITALTALAQGTVTAWWQSSAGGNLSGPISLADTQAAGLS